MVTSGGQVVFTCSERLTLTKLQDNVFIKANGKCCLGEFAPTHHPTADQLVDTEAWLAPELFDSQRIRNALIDGWRDYSGEFTKASDTFSLGCLAVQVNHSGSLGISNELTYDLFFLAIHWRATQATALPAGRAQPSRALEA